MSYFSSFFLGFFILVSFSFVYAAEKYTVLPGVEELINHAKHMPLSKKNHQGFELWLKMIGLENYYSDSQISTESPGINKYMHEKLTHHPEILSAYFGLYQMSKDVEKSAGLDTVTLDEAAGMGRFRAYRSGWMWDDLMKLTGHNAPNALLLIAILNEPEHKEMILMSQGGVPTPLNLKFNRDPFFHPRDLSANLDIDDSLKEKIKDIYRADGDNGPIAAKSYHFHFGAFMSCELLAAGTSPLFVKYLQEITGLLYRMAYLKADLVRESKMAEHHEHLSEHDQTDLDAQKILTYVSDKESVLTLLSLHLPHLHSWIEFHKKTAAVIHPWGWSTERYLKALNRLDRWMVDEEWTVEQHLAGYRFAAEHCGKLN